MNNKSMLLGFIVGVLLVGVLLTAVRWFKAAPQHTHYHANWAVYIAGERLDLSEPQYMEDVAACTEREDLKPSQRVHMHEGNQEVVHVHHKGVTWGHFFANLLPRVADTQLVGRVKQLESPGSDYQLRFILNGQPVTSVLNRVINSEDRLLIDYGNDSEEVLQSRYEAIAITAGDFNQHPDPASCSGAHDETWLIRLRKALFY